MHVDHMYASHIYLYTWSATQIPDRCTQQSHEHRQHRRLHPDPLCGRGGWMSAGENTCIYIYIYKYTHTHTHTHICTVWIPPAAELRRWAQMSSSCCWIPVSSAADTWLWVPPRLQPHSSCWHRTSHAHTQLARTLLMPSSQTPHCVTLADPLMSWLPGRVTCPPAHLTWSSLALTHLLAHLCLLRLLHQGHMALCMARQANWPAKLTDQPAIHMWPGLSIPLPLYFPMLFPPQIS